MSIKKSVFIFLVILISKNLFAQETQNQLNLNQILDSTFQATKQYKETFKNLLATETKIFQSFDKNSQLKKQTEVEANLLIYQSVKDKNISLEFRNVFKVDGKTIPNGNQNSEMFFAELAKAKTLKSELEKITDKGSKYDKSVQVSGITLNQGLILADNLRKSFQFNLIGRENFEGNEVYVVEYKQFEPNKFIMLNSNQSELNNPSLAFNLNLPKDLQKKEFYLQGKFWIDAKTFQIRREERNLLVKDAQPITIYESLFEFQNSEYEILVPKKITLNLFEAKKKNNAYQTYNDEKLTLEYKDFKKTETDVVILDDEK